MGKLIKMTIGLCLLCAGLAQATLVYKAGFNTYTNGQTITANATGDDDTFSGIVNAGGTQKAYDGSVVGMMTNGLSMRIGGATNNVTISQKALGAMPLMITSFDFYSPNISLKLSAFRTNSAGNPLALFTATDTGTSLDGKLVRATMVVNRSGSSITLPGSLGTLATNKYAVYYKYSGTYTLIGTIANLSSNANPIGFQMVNSFTNASEYTSYALYDNIGVWDSATNTVGGTSVLALNPGAKVAVVYRSGQLGWTTGQDVTDELDDLLAVVQTGDELILEARYLLTAGTTHHLPDDFTLAAEMGGGFNVTNISTNSTATLIEMGDRSTLLNLTISYLNTPVYTNTPPLGGEYRKMTGILVDGKTDVVIQDCKFEGQISHQIHFINNCDRPVVMGSHFRGGYWTVYLSGNITNAVFYESVWEQYLCDGIKTVRSGDGIQNALVEKCVFQDSPRDGIDTTGGFLDSIVRDCTFRRLGITGMDLKVLYEVDADLASDLGVCDVLIESNRFTDCYDAVVTTTLDRGMTNQGWYVLNTNTAQEAAVHNVYITNCVIEHTVGNTNSVRFVLAKDSHDIYWYNVQFWGTVTELRYVNLFDVYGGSNSSEAVSDSLGYNIGGTLGATNTPGAYGVTNIPFVYGPRPL